MTEVDIEDLRRIVAYDAETGDLARTDLGGRPAFKAIGAGGYRVGRVRGCFLLAHRVAWALHYGEWPVSQIDHINGVKTDNRIANLRLASNQQNAANQRGKASATSQYKGVSFHKQRRKWVAQCRGLGEGRGYIGLFETEEGAARAYDVAALAVFGEFARLNFPESAPCAA